MEVDVLNGAQVAYGSRNPSVRRWAREALSGSGRTLYPKEEPFDVQYDTKNAKYYDVGKSYLEGGMWVKKNGERKLVFDIPTALWILQEGYGGLRFHLVMANYHLQSSMASPGEFRYWSFADGGDPPGYIFAECYGCADKRGALSAFTENAVAVVYVGEIRKFVEEAEAYMKDNAPCVPFSLERLQLAVDHTVAHELMHAFGVPPPATRDGGIGECHDDDCECVMNPYRFQPIKTWVSEISDDASCLNISGRIQRKLFAVGIDRVHRASRVDYSTLKTLSGGN